MKTIKYQLIALSEEIITNERRQHCTVFQVEQVEAFPPKNVFLSGEVLIDLKLQMKN